MTTCTHPCTTTTQLTRFENWHWDESVCRQNLHSCWNTKRVSHVDVEGPSYSTRITTFRKENLDATLGYALTRAWDCMRSIAPPTWSGKRSCDTCRKKWRSINIKPCENTRHYDVWARRQDVTMRDINKDKKIEDVPWNTTYINMYVSKL